MKHTAMLALIFAALLAGAFSGALLMRPARFGAQPVVQLQLREIGGRQYVVATTSAGAVAITPYNPTR